MFYIAETSYIVRNKMLNGCQMLTITANVKKKSCDSSHALINRIPLI